MPNQPRTPLRSVRVPDELWTQAKEKAAQQHETVSSVIIAALEAYVIIADNGNRY